RIAPIPLQRSSRRQREDDRGVHQATRAHASESAAHPGSIRGMSDPRARGLHRRASTFAPESEATMQSKEKLMEERRKDSKSASVGTNRLARARQRLRDPEWRRYGYLLLAGKTLGIAFLFGGTFLISNLIGADVRADDAPVLTGNSIVNPI